MRNIILLITLVFSFVAFGTNLPSSNSQNILSNYFLSSIGFIGNHFFIFLLSFTLVSFIVFRSLKIELRHPQKNHILIILTQTLFLFVTGIFLSFVLLFVLAIFELNLLAYFIDINPKILGIQTNINDISTSLKNNKQIPNIIATDSDHFKELIAISAATTGTGNFFGKYILSSVPSFFVIPTKDLGPTLLIDKTLIISSVSKKDLETISPIVGYLFIKNYFPQRFIKHYPKIAILNDNEHIKFRQDDFAKKLKQLQVQIENSNNQIASISALIDLDKKSQINYQNLIADYYSQKNKQNSSCIAQGYYLKGVFIKTYTKKFCDLQVQNFDNLISSTSKRLDFYTNELASNTAQLKINQTLNNFFKGQITLTDSLKRNIPDELGLFVPEESIKVMVDTQSPHAIADYFETVVHEYYHYASHVKGIGFKTIFFEEGLTEYFARNTIKDNLNTSTNMGFPIFVKILTQISKIIPEAELADIYFNKDEAGLERALNRVYGDNFYKDNIILFETLPYVSNPNDLLNFGNKIMTKIGGPTIKQSDLYSTTSNY